MLIFSAADARCQLLLLPPLPAAVASRFQLPREWRRSAQRFSLTLMPARFSPLRRHY